MSVLLMPWSMAKVKMVGGWNPSSPVFILPNNAGQDTANSVQTITQTLRIKGQELNQITIFLVAVAAAFIEIFAADDVIFLHKVLNTNHSHFILPSSF